MLSTYWKRNSLWKEPIFEVNIGYLHLSTDQFEGIWIKALVWEMRKRRCQRQSALLWGKSCQLRQRAWSSEEFLWTLTSPRCIFPWRCVVVCVSAALPVWRLISSSEKGLDRQRLRQSQALPFCDLCVWSHFLSGQCPERKHSLWLLTQRTNQCESSA